MKNRHLLPLCWMLCVSLLAAGKAMSAADRQPGKTLQTAVATGTTAIGLQAGDDLLRVVSMKCVQSAAGWTAGWPEPVSIPLISFVEAGRPHVARPLAVYAASGRSRAGRKPCCLFSCDEPALELRSIWRAYAGPGPIEHTIRIINRGGEEVSCPCSPAWRFPCCIRRSSAGAVVGRAGRQPALGRRHAPRADRPGFGSSLVSTPHGGPIPW